MAKADCPTYQLEVLAQFIDADLQGEADCTITGLATLQDAAAGQLSFLANPVYRKYLAATQASAVIVHPTLAGEFSGNKILHENPYLGYAKLTALFDSNQSMPYGTLPQGIHTNAVVAATATISPTAAIGPFAVIEDGVSVGDNTQIGAGSYVGRDSSIGSGCRIAPQVSIYHGVSIGDDCIFHSGIVIGGDGFGFAPSEKGWVKIYQLGGVNIGNRVDIGAGTTIDRGALDNTQIADGVIIDNQVQIAHNVKIGTNTAIAGCAAIAGSTTIGANCTIAGRVGIVGHLHIADNVHITAMTMVTKSIDKPGSYSSGTPLAATSQWRKNAVRFSQLDSIVTRLKRLEKHRAE